MNVPGKLLLAFSPAIPSPDDSKGPQPRTYLHVTPIAEGDAGEFTTAIEAASQRVIARARLRIPCAGEALISRDILSRLHVDDDAWVRVGSGERPVLEAKGSFKARLELADGSGDVGAPFPDQAEVLRKFRRKRDVECFAFKVADLERVLAVAKRCDADRVAIRLPKVTGNPCYWSAVIGPKCMEGAAPDDPTKVAPPVGELEGVIAQVDPFGAKDETPNAGPVQRKLFEDGPSEDAKPKVDEVPADDGAAAARPRVPREWSRESDTAGLSLWQPWAAGVALGLKVHETRKDAANFMGGPWRAWVAIAATADVPKDAEAVPHLVRKAVAAATEAKVWGMGGGAELPTGAIVALAFLDADLPTSGEGAPDTDRTERSWGDWSDGRHAYRFSDVFVLPTPVPVKGGQRFYKLNAETLDLLAAAEKVRIR